MINYVTNTFRQFDGQKLMLGPLIGTLFSYFDS